MFGDKLKNLLIKKDDQGGNNKKKIENLVFFIVVLIITIVVINIIWSDKKTTNKSANESTGGKQLALEETIQNTEDPEAKNNLEEKLENILSKIQGVGEVDVCINYSETSEVVAMYNENSKTNLTEETDTSGGVRKIEETDTQKEIIYQEDSGEKTPVTQKIVMPKIEGAIIAAKGASNASVKTNIIQAVEAVTGLSTHKIQVFEMN